MPSAFRRPAKSAPVSLRSRLWLPPGVPGGLRLQLARGVAAEKVALHDTVPDHLARVRRDAFRVEARAGEPLAQVRRFAQLHERRKYLPAHAVEEEGGLAVQAAAAHGGNEVADEALGDGRLEQDGRLPRRNLARAHALRGALAGAAPNAFRRPPARPHRGSTRTSRRAASRRSCRRSGSTRCRGASWDSPARKPSEFA